jgi:hypothetical protein
MPIINHIKETYVSAVILKCEESGCKLSVDINNRKVICKGEILVQLHWGKQESICDGIVFLCNGHLNIVLAELKSKTVHASDICSKFKNAAKVANGIINSAPKVNKETRIHLIIAAKKWDRFTQTSIQQNLQRNKIGKPIFGKCGDSLSNIFNKYGIQY